MNLPYLIISCKCLEVATRLCKRMQAVILRAEQSPGRLYSLEDIMNVITEFELVIRLTCTGQTFAISDHSFLELCLFIELVYEEVVPFSQTLNSYVGTAI